MQAISRTARSCASSRRHPAAARQQHLATFRGPLRVACMAVKKAGSKQVVSSKTLVAKPESAEAVAKMAAELAQYSLDQMEDRSKGIVVFQVVRDAWETDTFHTWERYTSNTAMGKHNTSKPYLNFMTKVQPHLQRPVAMVLYEWKDGALGPACTSEGPKGEGGLDDATGASGAAGGASMKQTSASFNLGSESVEAEHETDKGLLQGLDKGLEAARKQMDGLKSMFGAGLKGMFGGKDKGAKAEEKEQVGAGGKGRK